MESFYEVLGLANDATQSEIHAAYLHQGLRCQIDLTKGSQESEETLRRITEAYLVPGEAKSRRVYDTALAEDVLEAGIQKRRMDLETAAVIFLQELIRAGSNNNHPKPQG